MTHPTLLQRPSRHEAVPELQNLLNRIGSLLDLDGDFGQVTERTVLEAQTLAGLPVTGVADQQTTDWLTAQPLPSPDLSTTDVTFVVKEEVSSRGYYDETEAFPHFPGEESGVTIGIGYSLRFQGTDKAIRDLFSVRHVRRVEEGDGSRFSAPSQLHPQTHG
jgi:peptidoglycan hydrolase-like protein with peptidoglycan-binding domain